MDERTEGEVSSLSAEMMVLQMLFVAMNPRAEVARGSTAVAEVFAQAADLISALPQRPDGGDDARHRERPMTILAQLRTAVLIQNRSRSVAMPVTPAE